MAEIIPFPIRPKPAGSPVDDLKEVWDRICLGNHYHRIRHILPAWTDDVLSSMDQKPSDSE